jgi:hypothetical protein
MAEAGLAALACARRLGRSDGDLITEVYAAMWIASGTSALSDAEQLMRETVYNIRGVAEALARCDRRASKHLDSLKAG